MTHLKRVFPDGKTEVEYNYDPDYGQASAAVCGALFQLAIEHADSLDRDKVRDELAKMDVVTFWGPVKFGPNGQINSLQPPVFQIQDAKPVVLFPSGIKQGDLVMIAPCRPLSRRKSWQLIEVIENALLKLDRS